MKAAENRARPAGAAKPRSLVSSSRRVPAPPAWPGPRALCVERVAGGGERWKRRSPRPVPAGLPGAAGERLARLQLLQQVLPAVLRDQPPCAPAELEKLMGTLPVGLWPELSLGLSPLMPFFFPLGRAAGVLRCVRGTLSLVSVVLSVGRVSVVLTGRSVGPVWFVSSTQCHRQYARSTQVSSNLYQHWVVPLHS